MQREHLSEFIRGYVEKGTSLDSIEWDSFTTCRHIDRLVDAASTIAFNIGTMCPPQEPSEWCSESGRRKLLALADAIAAG